MPGQLIEGSAPGSKLPRDQLLTPPGLKSMLPRVQPLTPPALNDGATNPG